MGSRLFVIPKRAAAAAQNRPPAAPRGRATQVLRRGHVEVSLSEPNVLVLDRPRFRIGQGKWQPPQEILRVDRPCAAAWDCPRGGVHGPALGEGLQIGTHPSFPTRRTSVELTYRFEVAACPPAN